MLLGEYAVLAGHPALVMAANRRVTISYHPGLAWTHYSDGIGPESMSTGGREAHITPTAAMRHHICDHFGLEPEPGSLHIDSTALQHNGQKLGLGSSAAVSVALSALLTEHCLRQQRPTLQDYIAAHDRVQGVPGSGFDVAAAARGGWLRFQRDPEATHAEPCKKPPIAQAFVWTGTVARTGGFIRRFRAWQRQDSHSSRLLANMGQATTAALAASGSVQGWLEAFERYCAHLRALAAVADLPIYAGGHERLLALASQTGILYKPCGAGGGDIGMAVAASSTQLNRYLEAVRESGFEYIDLECDPDGVRVQQ